MEGREVFCTLGSGRTEAEYRFHDLGKGWWSALKTGTPVMHVIDTKKGTCDCPGYKFSKPANKGCRHLDKATELQQEKDMSTENALLKTDPATIAGIIVRGNLNSLNEQEKAGYYLAVCQACGLNPATRPFEFLNLKGKVVLYALKACTEQLRKRDGVSVTVVNQEVIDGCYIVRVKAEMPDGRHDEDLSAVVLGTLQGEDRANAIMKAITKAKRRVTLSICGLGMLDETEVESIPDYNRVVESKPPVAAPAIPPTSYAVNPEQEQERREVVADCYARADRIGIAAAFAGHVHKAYGTDIDSLSVLQLSELQGRLIQKEHSLLQPKA